MPYPAASPRPGGVCSVTGTAQDTRALSLSGRATPPARSSVGGSLLRVSPELTRARRAWRSAGCDQTSILAALRSVVLTLRRRNPQRLADRVVYCNKPVEPKDATRFRSPRQGLPMLVPVVAAPLLGAEAVDPRGGRSRTPPTSTTSLGQPPRHPQLIAPRQGPCVHTPVQTVPALCGSTHRVHTGDMTFRWTPCPSQLPWSSLTWAKELHAVESVATVPVSIPVAP